MSEKRARVADEAVSAVDDDSPCKKRGLTIQTVKKWVTDNEKELNTTLWLTYDRLDRDHVSALKCKVCIQFEDQPETSTPRSLVGQQTSVYSLNYMSGQNL